MNPNYVKAQQLLALLYLKHEQNEKAYKILAKSIAIDVNNTLTLKYLDEIGRRKEAKAAKAAEKSKKPPKTVAELNERDALSGNDVIIPKSTYREVNYGLITFLNVVVGIIIGAAMIYFLVLPAREKSSNDEYKAEISGYADQVAMQNISISELERQIETLNKEKEALKSQLDEANSKEIDTSKYDGVLSAAAKYFATDMIGCADILYTLDMTNVTSQAIIDVYNNLCAVTYETAGKHYNNLAYQAFNAGKYAEAIPSFEKAVVFAPNNPDLLYNLGKCYKANNNGKNNDDSRKCFEKVIELYPDTEYADWAAYQKQD